MDDLSDSDSGFSSACCRNRAVVTLFASAAAERALPFWKGGHWVMDKRGMLSAFVILAMSLIPFTGVGKM
jgi:hypothetical protein